MITVTFCAGGGIPPGCGGWREKRKSRHGRLCLQKGGTGKHLAPLHHALRCWAMGVAEHFLVGLPWRWAHRLVDRILLWREHGEVR